MYIIRVQCSSSRALTPTSIMRMAAFLYFADSFLSTPVVGLIIITCMSIAFDFFVPRNMD